MENGKVITTVSDDIPSWEVEVWMKVSVEVSATEAVWSTSTGVRSAAMEILWLSKTTQLLLC